MKRAAWSFALVALAFGALPVAAMPAAPDGEFAGQVGLRIFLGMRDQEPTDWSGTIKVAPGRLLSLEVWMPEAKDQADLVGTFVVNTRRRRPTSAAERKRGRENMPVVANGMIAMLGDTRPDTEVTLATLQGEAKFKLSDLDQGTFKRLKGRVQIDRIGPSSQIVNQPTAEDTPAAATAADGTTYATYLAFTPGPDAAKLRQLEAAPEQFDNWSEPTGGDQLLLVARRDGKWGDPVPVTDPGLDLYRPAVAVGGDGTPWVFWSEHVGCDDRYMGGDWELYARAMKPGAAGRPIRLTSEPHADIFPTATTDSEGRVWVAWMAFRGGHSRILAARQSGAGFGAPETVADSPRNDWWPTVTAAADGHVAVVWDTYAKGDYDVYARFWQGGTWADPVAVAGSEFAEMNPTAVFDPGGRLWVAYDANNSAWGKDFGALEQTGLPLYRNRQVEVRVVDGNRVLQPVAAAVDVMPGRPWPKQKDQGNRGQPTILPRVGVDGGGRVWVTSRVAWPGLRRGIGTVWYTYATCYVGDHWTPAMYVTGTDAILDSRPALLPTAGGGLLFVSTCDDRLHQARGNNADEGLTNSYASTPEAVAEPQLEAVPEPIVAAPTAGQEPADVARLRTYQAKLNGRDLKLMRGEFHRHTEISSDGGGDGTLLDMWRYALDAASLDWLGNGDHDNGGGREYSWWVTQKTATIFYEPPYFEPMFTYERSCNYPDGHRNVVFSKRGIRTLARLRGGMGQAMDDLPALAPRPHTPDTQMLYRYLKQYQGVTASHTSGTDMGTDWRDNDPTVEPFVEIYQGDRQSYERPGAPRSNTADDSIGGWRPYGFVSNALLRGYRLAFQASSDHISTHLSYCNLFVTEPTRDAILDAFKNRRGYGSTDNILADLRCEAGGVEHFMGEDFQLTGQPRLKLNLVGTGPIAKVVVIRDNEVVYSAEPNQQSVTLDWVDNQPKQGATSYYYIRGEQADGELVWVSPMWITIG